MAGSSDDSVSKAADVKAAVAGHAPVVDENKKSKRRGQRWKARDRKKAEGKGPTGKDVKPTMKAPTFKNFFVFLPLP